MRPFPDAVQVHLFLLDQATHLLNDDFSSLPPGKRVYCGHRHRLLKAPSNQNQFISGGLFDLGKMIQESHWVISLPNHPYPPTENRPGIKKIAILLDEDSNRQQEALRLGTGLAGCNHHVTLFSTYDPTELQNRYPDTAPLLEALHMLNATIKTSSIDAEVEKWPVVLQL